MLRLGHDVKRRSKNGDIALDGEIFLLKDAVDLLTDQVWWQEATCDARGISHGFFHCFTLALIDLAFSGGRWCCVGHHRENVGHCCVIEALQTAREIVAHEEQELLHILIMLRISSEV